MINIKKAVLADAITIHKLAHQIYFPTYTGVLGQDQMEFMLEKSYTEVALQQSMHLGEDFFIVYDDCLPVGFMSLRVKDEKILRIEKLYLLPETQGLGVGKKSIDFALNEASLRGKSLVELNVNRGNKAYYFYLKMGFEVVELVDIPYFGYVLDDYVMQMTVSLT